MGGEVTTAFVTFTACLGAYFDGFISVVKKMKITQKLISMCIWYQSTITLLVIGKKNESNTAIWANIRRTSVSSKCYTSLKTITKNL